MFSIKDRETAGPEVKAGVVQLRARVMGDLATYSYSIDDGTTFTPIGSEVKLAFGWWKGARPAVFAFNADAGAKSHGFVDVDWVRYKALGAGAE